MNEQNRVMKEQDKERLVVSIIEAASPELQRRRQAAGPWAVLDRWSKELVGAAAIVAALAATALLRVGAGAEAAEVQVLTVADALVPETVAEWLLTGDGPAAGDLLVDFAPETRP